MRKLQGREVKGSQGKGGYHRSTQWSKKRRDDQGGRQYNFVNWEKEVMDLET